MKTLQKSNAGRPLAITADIITKLESVFQLGVTDKIACNYAGVAERTYYDRIKGDDEFRTRMDNAKHYARIAAGAVVVQAIKDKDVNTAKWWLEKKYPQEFGTPAVQFNQQFNAESMKLEIVKDEDKTE